LTLIAICVLDHSIDCGVVAQSVEQRTENPCVGGSIPPLATIKRLPLTFPVKVFLLSINLLVTQFFLLICAFLPVSQVMGAGINDIGVYDLAPLHDAAQLGRLEEVQQLLSHPEIDVDVLDPYGCTPLMLALQASENVQEPRLIEVVTALLDTGANINHQDREGWSALHWAVLNRRINLIKLLLQRGIDRDLLNRAGQTAIDAAWLRHGTQFTDCCTFNDHTRIIGALDADFLNPPGSRLQVTSGRPASVNLAAPTPHPSVQFATQPPALLPETELEEMQNEGAMGFRFFGAGGCG
jgi:hypothetical protein